MKKLGARGLSVMELLVALAIIGFAVFVALTQTQMIFKQAERMNDVFELESDQVVLNKLMLNAFQRGIELNAVHIPSADFATPGSFKARKNGALLVKTDMTACPNFAPGSAGPKTYIGMICCEKGSVADVTLPSGDKRKLELDQICPAAVGGLGVYQMDAAGVVSSTCYPQYRELNISKIGFNSNLGSDMHQITLLSTTGFTEGSAQGRRYEIIGAVGNTGAEEVTFCKENSQ